MATSKTLTPTNVTIQIPAMTDAPDQSVNSNCIDKLGDAVNTLNSKLVPEAVTLTPTADTVIDANRSYRVGRILVIAVRGHITASKSAGADIFTLPSGMTMNQSGIPFVIGIGGEWNISKGGYGYCRSNSIGATLSNGEYFHINATFTLNG